MLTTAVQIACQRYTGGMGSLSLSALVCLLLLGSVSYTPYVQAAESSVMPPPNEASAPQQGAHADTATTAKPSLREALKPDDDAKIDIHSYQRKDGAVVTEYARGGRVFKIKVQPRAGRAYYLYRQRDGSFARPARTGKQHVSPPTWIFKEF